MRVGSPIAALPVLEPQFANISKSRALHTAGSVGSLMEEGRLPVPCRETAASLVAGPPPLVRVEPGCLSDSPTCFQQDSTRARDLRNREQTSSIRLVEGFARVHLAKEAPSSLRTTGAACAIASWTAAERAVWIEAMLRVACVQRDSH